MFLAFSLFIGALGYRKEGKKNEKSKEAKKEGSEFIDDSTDGTDECIPQFRRYGHICATVRNGICLSPHWRGCCAGAIGEFPAQYGEVSQ